MTRRLFFAVALLIVIAASVPSIWEKSWRSPDGGDAGSAPSAILACTCIVLTGPAATVAAITASRVQPSLLQCLLELLLWLALIPLLPLIYDRLARVIRFRSSLRLVCGLIGGLSVVCAYYAFFHTRHLNEVRAEAPPHDVVFLSLLYFSSAFGVPLLFISLPFKYPSKRDHGA